MQLTADGHIDLLRRLEKEWSHTSAPPHFFMVWFLDKHHEQPYLKNPPFLFLAIVKFALALKCPTMKTCVCMEVKFHAFRIGTVWRYVIVCSPVKEPPAPNEWTPQRVWV